MRTPHAGACLWVRTILFALVTIHTSHGFQVSAQSAPSLTIRHDRSRIEIQWKGPDAPAQGAWPSYQLQRSEDLASWLSIGTSIQTASPGQSLALSIPVEGRKAFYRLAIRSTRVSRAAVGSGGAEVLGFASAFDETLNALGQISLAEFAALHPPPAYGLGLSWPLDEARYYEELNTAPEDKEQDQTDEGEWLPRFDFRLDPREKEVLKKNGFVVSERLGTPTFAEAFYRIWNDDLPVFVSTDALLQAWHRSYDAMLEELEETSLFFLMEQMLDGMASQVKSAAKIVGEGVLKESVLDADLFVTVARSLLGGSPVASELNQAARVAATLDAIKSESLVDCFRLFGNPRTVDFSQFKVRGHYENSERLGRYFKTVMWLGRTDLRVAGPPFEDCMSVRHAPYERELGTAIVLHHLLMASDQFQSWFQAEKVVQAFVGWTDSMNFGQLGDLLTAAQLKGLESIQSLETLKRLQDRIDDGQLGAQQIKSDYFVAPLGPERLALPRSFTVFGQRFVLDSWALAKSVYDDILWVENDSTNEVVRRVPSGLDVAFAAFGNRQVVPDLIQRISNSNANRSTNHSVRFRDGMPYQHNLESVRRVIESQNTASWRSTLYLGWLDTLRTLSTPTVDSRFPEAIRTRAWAMKTLNTQLASWTELRHDTILYAKQSYTPPGLCSYPDGYVEPRPEFFARLEQLALDAAFLIGGLPVPQWATSTITTRAEFGGQEKQVNLASIKQNQVRFFEYFAGHVARLRRLVEKELHRERFNPEDIRYLDQLIQSTRVNGAGGPRRYDGWYTRMFYQNALVPDPEFYISDGAQKYDALVADVHTDLPSPIHGDPGGVLHQATAGVHMLVLAVDHGNEKMIYAGPVFSHFEFEVVGSPKRISDSEWQLKLAEAGLGEHPGRGASPGQGPPWSVPPHPEWTREFLVPIPNRP